MHSPVFPKWTATTGTLMVSMLILTSGCNKSQQTGKHRDDEKPARQTTAGQQGQRVDTPRGEVTAHQPSAEATAPGESSAVSSSPRGRAAANSFSPTPEQNSSAPLVTKSSTRGKPAKSSPATQADSGDEFDSPEPTAEAALPFGVRLAPDVRLPVAAMPIDFTISPVAEEARQQIIKDYYSEVAAAVLKPAAAATAGDSGKPVVNPTREPSANERTPASPTTTAATDSQVTPTDGPGEGSNGDFQGLLPGEVIEEGEEGLTVVVSNRPEVESARQRADWRFKALFGDAAYNRMVMLSLIESRMKDQETAGGPASPDPISDGD